MNFSTAVRTKRAVRLFHFNTETEKLEPKTGWLELQGNGFLIDRETGAQYYPEGDEYINDNWRVEEETVRLTAREIVDALKSYLYGAAKKELITFTDGISHHDFAVDFARKFPFEEMPEIFAPTREADEF